ncbi:11774_t:CDS:2 [Ambispora gerdemannii]|uniref:11774_t:CDS:1 n=1 Tax=Ambispora gerdemannii TaxID=144530 RepID=A0A9N8ZVV3_9GLOM|nr:11774_t:CDS:2 [Ambispora gerdemannii]
MNSGVESNNSRSDAMENGNKYSLGERIILNVGGIKQYETYRSTLTAYPDTLLGTMFSERNKQLVNPTQISPAGNKEYFIDRDGHVFRYILQFYRTGKIPWPDQKNFDGGGVNNIRGGGVGDLLSPNNIGSGFNTGNDNSSVRSLSTTIGVVAGDTISTDMTSTSSTTVTIGEWLPTTNTLITRQEIENEMDYFQIPAPIHEPIIIPYPTLAAAKQLDAFIHSLKTCFTSIAQNFIDDISIMFYENRRLPQASLKEVDNENVKMLIIELVDKLFRDFALVGFEILDRFGQDIGTYLMETLPGLAWKLTRGYYDRRYFVNLSTTVFDHQGILENSCLAKQNNV